MAFDINSLFRPQTLFNPQNPNGIPSQVYMAADMGIMPSGFDVPDRPTGEGTPEYQQALAQSMPMMPQAGNGMTPGMPQQQVSTPSFGGSTPYQRLMSASESNPLLGLMTGGFSGMRDAFKNRMSAGQNPQAPQAAGLFGIPQANYNKAGSGLMNAGQAIAGSSAPAMSTYRPQQSGSSGLQPLTMNQYRKRTY